MPTERTPVRGTQTFVGVMGAVWGRPALTGLEICWRWVAGIGLFSLVVVSLGDYGVRWAVDWASLQSITVFQPVAAIQSLRAAFEPVVRQMLPVLRWLLPVVFVCWNIVAASGRNVVLRRLDSALTARRGTLLLLGVLRSAMLMGAWALWMWGVRWALGFAITSPAARGEEPSLVVFCALLICGTLGVYVAWAIVSWPLQLAPLLAMLQNQGAWASLVAALRAGPVRGKLLEINLVMCIVRLALIVLAMVWSASPLAFQSVATDQFFAIWWAIALLLYLVASDYFHVVRAAAYLRLWLAYDSTEMS